MKVFVDGPEKFKNSSEVLNAVEKVLETKLQEYMVSGEEILVGGKQGIDERVRNFLYLDHHYDKVLVCVHEGEVYRNEGDWPTYLISRFSFAKEEFMEFVDRAFIVWDQISMDAYVTLLGFVVWDKPVDVLLSTDMDIHTITTVEDVRKLLPPVSEDWIPLHKKLPKHMWRKIVRDFIPSEVYDAFL